jgi:hypothetical protein
MAILDFMDKSGTENKEESRVPKEAFQRFKYKKKPAFLIQEAMRLYLEGVKEAEIARRLKVSRQSVWIWRIEGGWEYRRAQITKDTDKIYDSVKEMKERHIKIARAIQGLMVKKIQEGELKISTSDGLKAMEHEAKIMMPENFSISINQQNTEVNEVLQIAQWAEEKKKNAKTKRPDKTPESSKKLV